jgi:ABC-2 type transport system ATP-binding protein
MTRHASTARPERKAVQNQWFLCDHGFGGPIGSRLTAPGELEPRKGGLRADRACDDCSVSDGFAIEVRDLRKRYGEREALRGIDVEVRRGEVFGLLGPNGAGKTTAVEILEGYRARDGGEVSVLGHDPERRPRALRRRIGIVLQSGGIYGHLSPREALRHWAALYPHPRSVEEVLALVGLVERADARCRTLSGGQLRRLDFALALIGDPELIFLDEPTTGFDPQARRAAWEAIRSLRTLGKTILLTTHYLDEAQALADRVAIVKDGRVLAVGPPQELGTHPPHPPGGASGAAGAMDGEDGMSGSDRAGGAGGAVAGRYRISYRDPSGQLIEHETDDPTALLHELTGAALARGERLSELSVGLPTLEDVYLELTADV